MRYILVISLLFSLNSFTMEADGWVFSVPLGRYVQEAPQEPTTIAAVLDVGATPEAGDEAEIQRREIMDRKVKGSGDAQARANEFDLMRELF